MRRGEKTLSVVALTLWFGAAATAFATAQQRSEAGGGVCGPGNGDCCLANGTPGCDDVPCCESVCSYDPYCCETEWDGFCAVAAWQDPNCDCVGGVHLVSATPDQDESLWRSANNIARFTFDGPIALPDAGEVVVQELLDGGGFGPELSGLLVFAVEGGNTLRIVEALTAETYLTHRKWYAIRNTGGWSGVAPFEVHYVVQVGDANNDGMVLVNDLSWINSDIPNQSAADDSRFDINGDGFVLVNDLSVANSSIPSVPVSKPTGH